MAEGFPKSPVMVLQTISFTSSKHLVVAELSKCGIQFFFATHSYFVVKKLYLLALETGQSVPVISADGDGWNINDLQDGLPENPIIDESVRLYEREVELSLK